MIKEICCKKIEFDDFGNMIDSSNWDEDICVQMAKDENIELSDKHWLVINFLRDEYNKSNTVANIRKITKNIDVNVKELYNLFPNGPAKTAARIAGLPKPKGCI